MRCPFCRTALEVRILRTSEALNPPVLPRSSSSGSWNTYPAGGAPVVIQARPSQVQQETDALFARIRAGLRRQHAVRASDARVPWEGEGALLRRFFSTIEASLSQPRPFFRKMGAGPSQGVWSFAATLLAPAVVSHGMLPMWLPRHEGLSWDVSLLLCLGLALILPLYVAVTYHVAARMLSHRRMRLFGTFRLVGYSLSPMLLGWIPIVGMVFGTLGALALQRVALSELWGLGTGRVLAVMVAPWIPVLTVLALVVGM